MKFLERIKQMFRKQADVTYPNEYSSEFDKWLSLYRQEPFYLKGRCKHTKNAFKTINAKISKYTTTEFYSAVDDEEINLEYQEFVSGMAKHLEAGFSLGSIVFLPLFKNGKIEIQVVKATNYVVEGVDIKGNIKRITFMSNTYKGKDFYELAETHDLYNGYYISRQAYKNGSKIPLSSVPEWSYLLEYISFDFLNEPLFAMFTSPTDNCRDNSHLPVSFCANILNSLAELDNMYSEYLREFAAKRAKTFMNANLIDDDTLKHYQDIPDYFILVNEIYQENKDGIKVTEETIRYTEYAEAINDILKSIENQVGLTRGSLSRVENVEKTATEVKVSSKETASTIADCQKSLMKSLKELETAMNNLLALNKVNKKIEITTVFGDGVLVDDASKLSEGIMLYNAGLISQKTFLMEYKGYDEERADLEVAETASTNTFTNDFNFE